MPGQKQDLEAARLRVASIQKVEPLTKTELKTFFAARKADASRRFDAQQSNFLEQSRLTRAITAPFRELIGPDERQKSLEAFKERSKLPAATRKLRRPKFRKEEPRITAGSIESIFVPPFFDLDMITNGHGSIGGIADAAMGFEEIFVGPDGGSGSASAGLFGLYRPISDMPTGLFRPLVRYGFHYHEESWGYTAHTTGTLTVSAIDVTRSPFDTLSGTFQHTIWQDGTSWYETHDLAVPIDAANPDFDVQWFGPIQIEFPLTAGHTYALLVEIGATADDETPDIWGASEATAQLQVQVPLMVVEETTGR
jgi:hypothetical protein